MLFFFLFAFLHFVNADCYATKYSVDYGTCYFDKTTADCSFNTDNDDSLATITYDSDVNKYTITLSKGSDCADFYLKKYYEGDLDIIMTQSSSGGHYIVLQNDTSGNTLYPGNTVSIYTGSSGQPNGIKFDRYTFDNPINVYVEVNYLLNGNIDNFDVFFEHASYDGSSDENSHNKINLEYTISESLDFVNFTELRFPQVIASYGVRSYADGEDETLTFSNITFSLDFELTKKETFNMSVDGTDGYLTLPEANDYYKIYIDPTTEPVNSRYELTISPFVSTSEETSSEQTSSEQSSNSPTSSEHTSSSNSEESSEENYNDSATNMIVLVTVCLIFVMLI
ncbi:hypothetical protein QTN25_010808 [Entamoeba marina]